jgi:hypothetical protein
MPRLLELFSGTGSVGRAFRAKGWEVVSVDINGAENPTIEADIRDLDVTSLGKIDVIWASPPCTLYSRARSTGRAADLESSDSLVRRTLEICAALGNPPLFIENPWTGQLKNRGLLDTLKLRIVDYCSYGMPYRKRTAIWTNTAWQPARSLCKHDCASSRDGRHLARAQQGPPGPRFTQRELYRIPPELCDEIAKYVGHLGTP